MPINILNVHPNLDHVFLVVVELSHCACVLHHYDVFPPLQQLVVFCFFFVKRK